MAFSPVLVKSVNVSILCYFSLHVGKQADSQAAPTQPGITIAPQAGLGEHLEAHVVLS